MLDIARPHETTPDGHVSYFSAYSDMYESYKLLRRGRQGGTDGYTDRDRDSCQPSRQIQIESERELLHNLSCVCVCPLGLVLLLLCLACLRVIARKTLQTSHMSLVCFSTHTCSVPFDVV